MNDMTKHDLEHELLSTKIEQISTEIESNNKVISAQIDTNQRVLITQLNSEFEVVNIRLDESRDENVRTNKKIDGALGQITLLEKDTDWIRTIKKYKLIAGMALIGLISVTNFKQVQEWIKGMLPWN